MRKLGMNFKLEGSWEGPYVVLKKNSSLSYGIDTGECKIPSVHIQLLKKYHNNDEETPKVGRATSVFEPDGVRDDILDRYAQVNILGDSLDDKQKSDIAEL